MKPAPQFNMADNRVQVQLPLFVVLGILAWFVAVLFIRFTGAMFFVESGLWLVGLYLVSIPGVWFLIKGIAHARKVSGTEILIAAVIMCFTASILDGVAIAWLPSIYGLQAPAHLLASAYLLWFLGVSLCVSIIFFFKN